MAVPLADDLKTNTMPYMSHVISNLKRLTFSLPDAGYKRHVFKKTKGGKIRVVDLPDYLVDEMEQYVRNLKKDGLKTGRGGEVDLFFEDPKEQGGPFPLSQRKAQRLIQRCLQGRRPAGAQPP